MFPLDVSRSLTDYPGINNDIVGPKRRAFAGA
jgi:hypothetical protein